MTTQASAISLRKKLILVLLPAILLLVFLSGGLAYYLAVKFSTLAYDRSLSETARDVGNQIQIVDNQLRLDLPSQSLNMIGSDQWDLIYYSVHDRNGNLIGGDPGLPARNRAAASDRAEFYNYSLAGHPVRVASLTRSLPAPYNTVFIDVAETLNKRMLLSHEILLAMILPEVILLFLLGIAVWVGVNIGLTPLSAIRKELKLRSHNDLTPLPEQRFPIEIGPLVGGMNTLFAHLKDAIDAQRRFISDAAHQLRTPIASLRTQIDLAKKAGSMSDLAILIPHLDSAASRLTHLAQQLLVLTRAEPHARDVLNLEHLDLTELAAEVTSDWVPRAIANNIDLGFEETDACELLGERIMLREMTSNLIENAIIYHPGGGKITVSVHENPSSATLTVTDDGNGIPEHERDNVLRRFYRIPGSSSTGSGLGLAIVRQIAETHGGKTTITNNPEGRGVAIQVTLPKH